MPSRKSIVVSVLLFLVLALLVTFLWKTLSGPGSGYRSQAPAAKPSSSTYEASGYFPVGVNATGCDLPPDAPVR